jgi:glycosyltransferase involved in cell wall biosynthesis
MGILARRLWKKPLVVKVLRGGKLGDLDKLHHRSTGSARIRRMVRQVDAFIAISHEIERELTAEGIEKERCLFLPNGVDVDFYHPLLKSQKTLLRKRMGLPEGFLCVYSGRLAPEKGLPDLLRAWQKITQQFPDASLLVLGSGEMEGKLREMAGRQ